MGVGKTCGVPKAVIDKVQGYSIPKEVQAFVVILGYWWIFKPHLAQCFCPLCHLVKKGYIWDWGAEQLPPLRKPKILVSWNLTGRAATSFSCLSKPGRHGLGSTAKTTKGVRALRVLAPTVEGSGDQMHLIEQPVTVRTSLRQWVGCQHALHWPASAMAQTPTLTKLQTYLQQRRNLSNSTRSPETVNVSVSKPVEKFYESLFEPNRGHCLKASSQQTEKMLPRMSFSIPFIYLELRRAHKEDCKKVRKSKAGKSLIVIGL